MREGLIRIVAPHFVAGIEIDGAIGCYDYEYKPVKIHRCAPILKYMKGWTIARIMHYCKIKGWKCEFGKSSEQLPKSMGGRRE